jgi:hypothetical protein
MPLVVRTNGNSSSNIITATWFNDIRDLLTGVMTDQTVKLQNLLILKAIGAAPSAAAAGSLGAGTTLGIGAYVYVYTYANADGESKISPVFNITTTSNNQHVNLTGITVGPTGTTRRYVYRTAVGGGTAYKFLTTIGDNTTTTLSDSATDGSLGASPPTASTFGGALILQDSTGAPTFIIANDGTISSGSTVNTGNLSVTGTLAVSGTSTVHDLITSTGKLGKVTAGDVMDFSAGTDTTIKAISGRIKLNQGTDVTGTFTVSSTSTFNAAATISSGGLTISGGTLIAGAITASGTINANGTLNANGAFNCNTIGLTLGSWTRVSQFSGTATTTSTNFNHGLGAVPDIVLLTLTIVSSTPHMITYDPSTLTSSQVKVQSDGTNSFVGLAIKF